MGLRFENTTRGRALAGEAFAAQGWVLQAHSDGTTFQVMRPGHYNWAALVRAVMVHDQAYAWRVTTDEYGVTQATPLWAAAMWAWRKGLLEVTA